MKRLALFLALAAAALACVSCAPSEPLKLHPDNPHVFLLRGKPAILAGSTEHYGAVLNLDFDYGPYLDELEARGLNLTRTFSGVYCEAPGAFNITRNTLAPDSSRLICPWARSREPGYANGGNKFDLGRWDESYFTRLRDFVGRANRRNVVVELDLFCVYYEDSMWDLSPLNGRNNVNGIGNAPRGETLTLKHADLTRVQEDMTRKIVTELNRFDNVYYEICNEPYFGVTGEWQAHIAQVIVDTEKSLPKKHLISQNVANNSLKIEDPDPNVSIFNFHYAVPAAAAENLKWNRPIGDNETGFAGTADRPYRREAWNFLLAGGALFNHLDYSFTVDHEDGSFAFPPSQPGGGGPSIRSQIGLLRSFLESMDLVRLRPDAAFLGALPEGMDGRAMSDSGLAWAAYLSRPAGGDFDYALRWTGRLVPDRSGVFILATRSDDGIRVFTDGVRRIENWTDHGPALDSAAVTLEAGRPVELRVEFYQGLGGAVAQLLWSAPGGELALVPADRFRDPDGNPGLRVEKFADREFTRPVRSARSADLDFDGSLASLFPAEETRPEILPFTLTLSLAGGRYRAEWFDPRDGRALRSWTMDHAGGAAAVECPPFEEDIVLSVRTDGTP